jgi:protein TonB
VTGRAGTAGRTPPSIAWAIAASFVLHAAFATAMLSAHPAPRKPAPPSYRVNLVAAPPGPAATGVVAPTPAPAPAPAPPAPPKKIAPPPKAMPAPAKAPPKKTPAVAATPVPPAPPNPAPAAAAAGATGGHGTDVASVHTEGADFPYPQYLENIVRVIAQRFKPQGNTAARAEVSFIIRRDGSIVPTSIQFVTRSGNFAFDLEAEGAVEQAAAVKAFGPLPAGFADDVLPVVFSFDPRVLQSR